MNEDVKHCLECVYGEQYQNGYSKIAFCNHPYRTGTVGGAGTRSIDCIFFKKKEIKESDK